MYLKTNQIHFMIIHNQLMMAMKTNKIRIQKRKENY